MLLHNFYSYLAAVHSVPQKGRGCGKEKVALSALLLTSAITEAFGVKDRFPPPPSPLSWGTRPLIKLVERPGLGSKVTFQTLGIMEFFKNLGEELGRGCN